MQKLIIFSAFLAMAVAAPGVLIAPQIHVPLGKTTVTKSSQIVDHGSTYIHHPIVPVVHAAPVHHPIVPVVHATPIHSHVVHLSPVKSTLTRSSQVVDHGSTAVIHPIVHAPVLVHASPLAYKTGDSAVSHHSSTVHETLPLIAVHH